MQYDKDILLGLLYTAREANVDLALIVAKELQIDLLAELDPFRFFLQHSRRIDADKPLQIADYVELFKQNQLFISGIEYKALHQRLLQEIPDCIGNLINLQTLSIAHSNVHTLPTSLGNLNELVRLYLNNNYLSAIPASLSGLQRLEVLDLNNNSLRDLPLVLDNLVNLRVLHLKNNHLHTLPESLGRLPNLMSIDLTGNPLDKKWIPPILFDAQQSNRNLAWELNKFFQ